MSTPTRPETLLAVAMRRQAEAAMAATDTELELARFVQHGRRDAGRRRARWAALAAACVAVAAAAALGLQGRGGSPPPADRGADRPVQIDLDRVTTPAAPVEPVAVSPAEAPVAVPGVGAVAWLGHDPGGRSWMLRDQQSALEWSLDPVPDAGTPVAAGVAMAARTVPRVAFADDVAVVAVQAGGPLPGARDFLSRRDGLLRVDLATGTVLGFTPVQDATDVAAAPDGTVWAVTAPDAVVQLDPRSGRTLRTLQPPELAARLGVGDGSLWLVDWTRTPSRVRQVDPTDGALLRTFRLTQESIPVPVGDLLLLVTADGRVLRVPADGDPTGRALVLPGPVDDVAGVDDAGVWLRQRSTLVRVAADTLAVEYALTLPWQGWYAVTQAGEDAILVADFRDGALRRIPLPDSG